MNAESRPAGRPATVTTNRKLDNWAKVIFLVCYLLIAAVFARMLPYYWPTPERWIVLGSLSLYTLLFALERPLSRIIKNYIHFAFVIQLFIMLVLLFIVPENDSPQDYFTMLVVPMCAQVAWGYSQRASTTWLVILAVTAFASMIAYSLIFDEDWSGIGLGLSYVVGCLIGSVMTSVTRRAEEARIKTQALYAELQEANQKLQEYTLQAEQLAAAEERSRLARDLHDSVSQTIFSLTLTAQAARILLERDPAKVPAKLDHLQALAQSALAEMRYLIRHLGPGIDSEVGLCENLRRHAAERQAQDGLAVELDLSGERRLPAKIEEGLFRVVQEALNNIVKHARTDRAWVRLRLDEDPVTLTIEDRGAGFDPAQVRSAEGHLGLAGIADRVRIMGGQVSVESQPGAGTRISVSLDMKEAEHA